MSEPARSRLRRCAAPRGDVIRALSRLRGANDPPRSRLRRCAAPRGDVIRALSRLRGANEPPRSRLHGCASLRLCGIITCAWAVLAAAPYAWAEKADKEKPINFSAEQPAEVDFAKRVGTL